MRGARCEVLRGAARCCEVRGGARRCEEVRGARCEVRGARCEVRGVRCEVHLTVTTYIVLVCGSEYGVSQQKNSSHTAMYSEYCLLRSTAIYGGRSEVRGARTI